MTRWAGDAARSPRLGGAIGRRALLQALGLGAAFLPSLHGRAAGATRTRAAGEPAALQRLFVLFITQGTFHPNWRMAPAGQPDDQRWEMDLRPLERGAFSRCLEPLYPVRERLLLLDGISMGMIGAYGRMPHHTGHAVALSGAKPTLDGDFVTRVAGPSIDQMIAAAHPDPGPIPSLHYGKAPSAISHDLRGAPVPSEADPRTAMARLFPGAESAGGVDPRGLRAAQISVLDRVARQTKTLASRLGAEDRQKLEQHHGAVRDLERRLRGIERVDCGPRLALPPEPSDPIAAIDWSADAWTEMAIVAMSCGMTRVAAVYDPGPTTPYLGLPGGDIHTDYAHRAGFVDEANEAMTRFYRYYAERLRRVVERLAAIPEGDGSMLDNTLVLLANELGHPNHDWDQYPMVLAGGSKRLRLGRYLHWPAEHAMKNPLGPDVRVGPSHHRALVSVARAFGLDVRQIGERTLPASDGGAIDVTGELDGLG